MICEECEEAEEAGEWELCEECAAIEGFYLSSTCVDDWL